MLKHVHAEKSNQPEIPFANVLLKLFLEIIAGITPACRSCVCIVSQADLQCETIIHYLDHTDIPRD